MVLPSGVNQTDPNDFSVFVGYSLGFNDPMVFGGSGNSTREAGKVKSVCYYMEVDGDKLDNYCQTTLLFGPFGQLTFVGPYPDFTGSDFKVGISGGTGLYDGASGSVRVQVKAGGMLWKYSVILNQPPKCKPPPHMPKHAP